MMTDENLYTILVDAYASVPPRTIWRHQKTGHLYMVLTLALDESDPSQVLVVYDRLSRPGLTWAWPLAKFTDTDGQFARES